MTARASRKGTGGRAGLVVLLALAAAGCELAEVTLAEPERAVVAEAYVELGFKQLVGLPPGSPQTPYNMIYVFLHETLDVAGKSGKVDGARISVTRPSDGLTIRVGPDPFFDQQGTNVGGCVFSNPPSSTGTCYRSELDVEGPMARLGPGDRLALRIELPGGRVLTSETVVPGRFELLNVADGGTCALAPRTATGLLWSRSAGAWAYGADTYISGLGRFFPKLHVEPLYLFGLSVSAADTAIVFPREFGVFSRADLDHDVATGLQVGLPDTTSAVVTVTAVDRNWVNWARGGNFNPSGQVRVPSIRGDGTGVFGSGMVRSFRVISTSRPGALPACPPDVPESSH